MSKKFATSLVKLSLLVLLYGNTASFAGGLEEILVPGVETIEAQTLENEWSCGLNQLARILAYYGIKISYEQLMREMPRSLTYQSHQFGPTPLQIVEAFNRNYPNESIRLELQEAASLADLTQFIYEKRPVMALLQLGSSRYFGLDFVRLHFYIPMGVLGLESMEVNSTSIQEASQKATGLALMATTGYRQEMSIAQFMNLWNDWYVNLDYQSTESDQSLVSFYEKRYFDARPQARKILEIGGQVSKDRYLKGNTIIVPVLKSKVDSEITQHRASF